MKLTSTVAKIVAFAGVSGFLVFANEAKAQIRGGDNDASVSSDDLGATWVDPGLWKIHDLFFLRSLTYIMYTLSTLLSPLLSLSLSLSALPVVFTPSLSFFPTQFVPLRNSRHIPLISRPPLPHIDYIHSAIMNRGEAAKVDSAKRGQIGIWLSYIVVCGKALLTICIAISLRSMIARLEIRTGMIIVEEL